MSTSRGGSQMSRRQGGGDKSALTSQKSGASVNSGRALTPMSTKKIQEDERKQKIEEERKKKEHQLRIE